MSDSPESKKSSTNSNPDAAPKPAAEPLSTPPQQANAAPPQPSVPTPVQSNVAPTQTAQNATAASHVPVQNSSAQFKAENIGSWAAHQEGYFAEQNRKAEEKRKKSEQTRKKVMPIVFIVGGVIAAGLIIWGIVALIMALTYKPEPEIPVISGGSSEDIGDYKNILQDFFNKNNGDLAAVDDAVKDVLNTNEGKEHADQVKMAQGSFLLANGYYEEAAAIAEQINPDSLDTKQKSMLYALLAAIYAKLGDFEKANYYDGLMYETNLELGGEGGA